MVTFQIPPRSRNLIFIFIVFLFRIKIVFYVFVGLWLFSTFEPSCIRRSSLIFLPRDSRIVDCTIEGIWERGVFPWAYLFLRVSLCEVIWPLRVRMAPFHTHSRGSCDCFACFVNVIRARTKSGTVIGKFCDFSNKSTMINGCIINIVSIISNTLLVKSTRVSLILINIKLQDGSQKPRRNGWNWHLISEFELLLLELTNRSRVVMHGRILSLSHWYLMFKWWRWSI